MKLKVDSGGRRLDKYEGVRLKYIPHLSIVIPLSESKYIFEDINTQNK